MSESDHNPSIGENTPLLHTESSSSSSSSLLSNVSIPVDNNNNQNTNDDNVIDDDTFPPSPRSLRSSFLSASSIIAVAAVIVTLIGILFKFYISPSLSTIPSSSSSSPLVFTPPHDDRSFSTITLPNQIQILLISTETSSPSSSPSSTVSASISISTGFYEDPHTFEGTAHLLEHLSFLGSTNYPTEGEIFRFIGQNGGMMNAYTKEEETNFFFKMSNNNDANHINQSTPVPLSNLEEGLLRLSDMVFHPQLYLLSIGREINAVDSEHNKNKLNDERRRYEVLARVSDERSPLHRFATGNRETFLHEKENDNEMNKVNITERVVLLRDNVINFHSSHYHTDRCKVAILSHYSIKEMEEMAKRVFGNIKTVDNDINTQSDESKNNVNNNNNILVQSTPPSPLFTYHSLPFPSSTYSPHIAFIQSILSPHYALLSLQFQLPSLQTHSPLSSSHVDFLTSLISAPSSSSPSPSLSPTSTSTLPTPSLFSLLHSLRFIRSLHSSTIIDSSTFSIYQVDFYLTPLGTHHVNDIISLYYSYMNIMYSTLSTPNGIKHLRRLFVLYKHTLIIQWENQYSNNYDEAVEISSVASNLQYMNMQDVLNSPHHYYFNATELLNILGVVSTPSNMIIQYSASSLDKELITETDEFYNTQFGWFAIPNGIIRQWKSGNDDNNNNNNNIAYDKSSDPINPHVLSLLQPKNEIPSFAKFAMGLPNMKNPYMPKDFTIKEEEESSGSSFLSSFLIHPPSAPSVSSSSSVQSIPSLLVTSPYTTIWFKQDIVYHRPLSYLFIDFKFPSLTSHYNHIDSLPPLLSIYCALIDWRLNSYSTFYFNSVGFSYDVSPLSSGFRLTLNGFSSTFPVVLNDILDAIEMALLPLSPTTPLPLSCSDDNVNIPLLSPEEFIMIRTLHMDSLTHSLQQKEPWQRAQSIIQYLTQRKSTEEESISRMENINISMMKEMEDMMWGRRGGEESKTHIEMFLYGNNHQKDAIKIEERVREMTERKSGKGKGKGGKKCNQKVEEVPPSSPQNMDIPFNGSSSPAALLPLHPHVLRLPSAFYLYRNTTLFPQDTNSALYISIFTNRYSALYDSLLLELFVNTVKPSCFLTLRTKYQLGYVVSCTSTLHWSTVQSMDIVIQGNSASPSIMLSHVKSLITEWNTTLNDMTEEHFSPIVKSLRNSKEKLPPSMLSVANEEWEKITSIEDVTHDDEKDTNENDHGQDKDVDEHNDHKSSSHNITSLSSDLSALSLSLSPLFHRRAISSSLLSSTPTLTLLNDMKTFYNQRILDQKQRRMVAVQMWSGDKYHNVEGIVDEEKKQNDIEEEKNVILITDDNVAAFKEKLKEYQQGEEIHWDELKIENINRNGNGGK